MIDANAIAKSALSSISQMHSHRRPAFVPTEDQLSHMVRDVFWASLDKYEGIPLAVRLFFAPANSGPHALQLESEATLKPSEIRELSPAHTADGALVAAAGRDGGLAIHSLLYSSASARGGMPRWLAVESRGPGLVTVLIGSKPILEFVRGKINRIEGMSHDRTAASGMLISAGLFPPNLGYQVASMLLDIGQAIDRNGTGGAIWILPTGSPARGVLKGLGRTVEPNTGPWVPFQEMWQHRTAVITLLNSQDGPSKEWLRAHPWIQSAAQDWEHLRQDATLRSVSGLARIDGSILMNGDPQVLAFGVICNTFPVGTPSVLESKNASKPMEGEEVDPSKFGGSRHRSAINFCADNAPAGAIVASHDGGLTLFAATTKNVVVGSKVSAIDSDSEVNALADPAVPTS